MEMMAFFTRVWVRTCGRREAHAVGRQGGHTRLSSSRARLAPVVLAPLPAPHVAVGPAELLRRPHRATCAAACWPPCAAHVRLHAARCAEIVCHAAPAPNGVGVQARGPRRGDPQPLPRPPWKHATYDQAS